MRLLGVAEPVARADADQPRPDGRVLPGGGLDWARISQIAYAEEDAFRRTLATGTQIFDLAVADAKREQQTTSLPVSGRSSCTTRTASRST